MPADREAAAGANAGAEETVAQTAQNYGRGVLGALLVSVPLLATMEMWWLGFSMTSWKMILFVVVNFGVLVILEYFSGFHDTVSLRAEILDALSAYGIGLLVAVIGLGLFNNLRPGMGLHELLGKIVLQSIPLSIGASIAMSQLGQEAARKKERKSHAGVLGSMALSLAGAWYFGFNVAPTEEPLMVGLRITPWHAIALVLGAMLITHAIVYSLDFAGGKQLPEGLSWWGGILAYGTGSAIVALLTAAFFLFVFGRIGLDTGLGPALHMIAVLGFVNSLGAAAAKLIL